MSFTLPDAPASPFSLSHLGLIKLTGEESVKYLQGQVTADVSALQSNTWIHGAHCDAKGKMFSCFKLFFIGEDLYLLGHKEGLSASLPELNKFAVFSKTDITEVSEEHSYIAATGETACNTLLQTLNTSAMNDLEVRALPQGTLIQWPGETQRLLFIQPTADTPVFTTELDDNSWLLHEVANNLTALPQALVGEHPPQHLNLHLLDGISFTKGCYIGQETVARMKYLGRQKRATWVLMHPGKIALSSGDELELELGEDKWRRSGQLVQSATTESHTYAQAILPTDLEENAILRLKSQPEVRFTLATQAYSINQDSEQ